MISQIIGKGAEATITKKENIVEKNRIPKYYRLKILDEKLRKQRTRKEAKILEKAKTIGVNVPNLIRTDQQEKIEMEFIQGDKLSETLNSYDEKKQKQVMKKLGEQVTLLHDNDIIHGDLTTSNTILKENKIFIIDFGLSITSHRREDKAVDLHLIKQALEAKHYQNWETLFKSFLQGYKPKEKENILNQLKEVEGRGRYKH
jgi:TP53 regulating kinase-like protein